MASDSAIWRSTTIGAEASSEKIEFNDLSLANEIDIAGINQSNTKMVSSVGVNPKPNSAVDELQDTGFAGLVVILTGSIKNTTDASSTSKIHYLKSWLLEDKTTTSFPLGRFGLRMNDFPIFNLTPTLTRGYMLTDVEFVRDGSVKGKVAVIMTLRFNGDLGTKTGGIYSW